MRSTKTYEFVEDSGHGWLKVKADELFHLGIQDKISTYSYVSRDRRHVYLEEDCDLSVFIEAKKEQGQTVKFRERFVNRAKIRYFLHYTPRNVILD